MKESVYHTSITHSPYSLVAAPVLAGTWSTFLLWERKCMHLEFVDSANNDWLFGEDILVTDVSSYSCPPFS